MKSMTFGESICGSVWMKYGVTGARGSGVARDEAKW